MCQSFRPSCIKLIQQYKKTYYIRFSNSWMLNIQATDNKETTNLTGTPNFT